MKPSKSTVSVTKKDPTKAYINYVDTLPGMGKTEAAVRMMAQCIKDKKGIFLYAAPTLILLHEVRKRLAKELNAKQLKRVFALHTESDDVHAGQTLTRQVKDFLDEEATPGTAILVTHATFTNLPQDIKHRNKVTVIFDEAYKCVFKPMNFTLTKEEAEAFISFVELDPDPGDYKKVSSINPKLLRAFDVIKAKKQFSIFEGLRESVRDKTSELYVTVTGDDKNKFEFREVKIPSRMFNGWADVYLMSAYLKTTQLWAMLVRSYFVLDGQVMHMKPGRGMFNYNQYEAKPASKSASSAMLARVHLTDKTAEVIPNYKKRLRQFKQRYGDATIVALTDNRLLTRNTLLSVLAAAKGYEEKQEELRQLVRNLRGTDRFIKVGGKRYRMSRRELLQLAYGRAKDRPKDEPTKRLLEWFNTVEIVHRRPWRWYVDQALRVSRAWLTKYDLLVQERQEMVGGKLRPRYYEQTPLLLLNVKEQEKIENIPDLMERVTLIPFECAGLDTYQDHQVVTFLAALNPDSFTSRFYAQVLPHYDPRGDYAVSAAVQAITRGALRKNDSKDKVLIIVADIEMAQLLKARLLDQPTVLEGWKRGIPQVRTFEFKLGGAEYDSEKAAAYRNRRTAEEKERFAQERKSYDKERYERTKSNPFQKTINRLRARLTRLQRRLKVSEPRDGDLVELNSLRDALTAEQQKLKQWMKANKEQQ